MKSWQLSMDRRIAWAEVQLLDIAHLSTGNTPSKKVPGYYGGDIPFVKPPELRDRKINLAPETLSEQGCENARLLPENAVLVSCIGNLGKTGIAGTKVAFNQQINAIEAFSGIDPRFVFYQAQSQDFKNQLEQRASATTISIVNKGNFSTIKVWIPPTNEQHRIVAKIEELFSELDKGIESLKTAREQLKVYRQALLKHAFEGKLTEQWRKDNADKLETADQLLERIKQEREARYQQQLEDWKAAVKQWEVDGKEGTKPAKPRAAKKLERPSSSESKGYENIPDSWCLAKIGDVSSVGTGVTPLKSRSDYYDNGDVPWVTSGALNSSLVSEASGYVTELAFAETNLRLYPKHTLLMAMYGEGKTRGKCSELLIPATTNQAIAAMVQCGIEEDTRPYLKWFLMKNYIDIRRKSSGGVQPNLNLGIVENTVFPLCSTGEMEVIVNELETNLSVIDDNEKTIVDQLLKSEALRQSILKKAFSGQLVPQDPDDEPASVLLDRIAKEKEEAAAKAKPARRAGGKAKAAQKKPKTTRTDTRKAS